MKRNGDVRGCIISRFGSQTSFADVLGHDPAVVCDVLRGKRRLSPAAARKWSILLDCPEEMLQPITREPQRSS
jgi:hypothetical protein